MRHMRNIAVTVVMGFAAFSGAHAAEKDVAASSTDAARAALAGQVKALYAAKDCPGLTNLFYTEGVDDTRKQALTATIAQLVCVDFDHPITVKFESADDAKTNTPGDFEGKASAYTLSPLGALVIDYGQGQPGTTRSMSFLYGEKDGTDYLITTKNADAK